MKNRDAQLDDEDLLPRPKKVSAKKRSHFIDPTDAERAHVKTMSGLGLNAEQIGMVIRGGVSGTIIRKRFRSELDLGKTMALTSISQSVFHRAKKSDILAIFWLKTQGHWCDHQQPEPTKGMIEALKLIAAKLPE